MEDLIHAHISSPSKKPKRTQNQKEREIEKIDEGQSPWEILTTELLLHILYYLNYEDKCSASIVCKMWRDVICMEKVTLRLIIVDEVLPTRFHNGVLFKGMTIVDAAKTVCKNAFSTNPSQSFAFFHKGRKIPWVDNYHTLQQYNIRDGETLSWKFSFIRAFIYDSCWYPSPPYKCELTVEYNDSIGHLRSEIVDKIGHKTHAFDVLYRGIKYHPDTMVWELMPSHYHHNKIIFNVVRRPGAPASDFSSLSDKDRHNRRYVPLTQIYPMDHDPPFLPVVHEEEPLAVAVREEENDLLLSDSNSIDTVRDESEAMGDSFFNLLSLPEALFDLNAFTEQEAEEQEHQVKDQQGEK